MRLPKISVPASIAGFTLLETLLSMAILFILLGAGLPIAANFYKDYQFDGEYDLLFSILEQARNQALVNLNEASHGVSINGVNYVLFQGASFAARDASQDRSFPRSGAITITGSSELVFNELDGTTASTTLTLSNGVKSRDLYINSEGSIYR